MQMKVVTWFNLFEYFSDKDFIIIKKVKSKKLNVNNY